ncbi:hypothetical protein NADFUDRAFT_53253 [Nadsonia fulvescens var. elongata DSM 6958]|uniref:J domain-containing protein n=1 Tax=Nadsonia fulvescens var. elongata DSM 6958 TaxID=857566 RepID=A0A1E3PE65_9ASCO|nr:hypothetical protein NADFUDRAFT_53253 [Nadsonia fulvescens var. elongata DSM 6958]
MVLPILIGTGIAVAAYTARVALRSYQRYKLLHPAGMASDGASSPHTVNTNFYMGGFAPKMSRQEAMLIMGITEIDLKKLQLNMGKRNGFEKDIEDLLKNKYRQLLKHNHPDKGGSSYIMVKVNEARDLLNKELLKK